MKKEKNYEAIYQYRCRHCKKFYFDMVGGWNTNRIINELLNAINKTNTTHHQPDLLGIHCCSENKYGISDFIGVSKRKA